MYGFIKIRGLFLGHRHRTEKDLKRVYISLPPSRDVENLKLISQTGSPNIIGTTVSMNFDEKHLYRGQKKRSSRISQFKNNFGGCITGESLFSDVWRNRERERERYVSSDIFYRLEIDRPKKKESGLPLLFIFGVRYGDIARLPKTRIVDPQRSLRDPDFSNPSNL